ncbi:MAG: transcriptional regulator, partial [Asticcacaulis sp.]
DYWQAMRQHTQTVVVDVAAFDRSTSVLQLAPFVDGVIMVVSEDQGDVSARVEMKAEIEHAGGQLMGMVYNRARLSQKGAVRRPAGAGGRIGRIAAL